MNDPRRSDYNGLTDTAEPGDGSESELHELLSADVKDAIIDRLRGQLQNCVNHLERAKRQSCRGGFDDAIDSANKALYETLGR